MRETNLVTVQWFGSTIDSLVLLPRLGVVRGYVFIGTLTASCSIQEPTLKFVSQETSKIFGKL